MILSLCYLWIIYKKTNNLKKALIYTFLLVLPFAKGKTFELRMLDKEQVNRYILFNISYFVPLYLSDFYLILILYWYFKNKINSQKINNKQSWPNILFFIYLMICLSNVFFAYFPNVILLASLQLTKFLIIFNLSLISQEKKFFNRNLNGFLQIIGSLNIFQLIWVILQKINGGPLGKYIEATLPGAELGIRSYENLDIIRLSGTFFEPSMLGTFTLMNLIIFLSFVKKKPSKFALLNIFASIIIIILTASRGIYLLTLVLIIASFQKINFQKLKIKSITLGLLFASLTIIALFANYIFIRITDTRSFFGKEGSGTYRLQITDFSLRLLRKNFLTGVGLEHSPYYLATSFPKDDYIFDPAHPHNLFVQILAENGLLGFISFGLFIYLVLRPYLYNKVKINDKVFFFKAIIVYLLASQFYPIYISTPELSSWLFLYLGISHYEQ